ncbi:hypothetical protein ACSLBF_21130 (plasmid) [Pseudoalteromonas sp. T1lg65]|uniref:hypothetical protein n=1 Tax=Pseudoalteromonas sp. T1lg65 TaxID=2077101 RepID=UPI003F795278
MFKISLFSLLALGVSGAAYADYGITVYGGKTISEDLLTTLNQTHKFEDESHYALSVDRYVQDGRYGLYYAKSDIELTGSPLHQIRNEYLLFQSAVIRPLVGDLHGYLGAQLGINYMDPNFLEADTFFASGLYAGLEYAVGAGFHVSSEIRWLATLVDNKSTVSCDTNPETKDVCSWQFDGDVFHQYQASLSVSYRFSL